MSQCHPSPSLGAIDLPEAASKACIGTPYWQARDYRAVAWSDRETMAQIEVLMEVYGSREQHAFVDSEWRRLLGPWLLSNDRSYTEESTVQKPVLEVLEAI